ncbi:hypothetical protein IZ6_25000 [Terrihabitans soli]|uniref:Uncharacterized protein n=1 Tax=Terrihabitans soli TaxID=708113 RepID=A0A6S6QW09_9HYPH|nr:hypothetical protein [Terrihabitans soli]BCJ91765.1 hypothetical protein IZ6_25000 [Terrihabitans soli]
MKLMLGIKIDAMKVVAEDRLNHLLAEAPLSPYFTEVYRLKYERALSGLRAPRDEFHPVLIEEADALGIPVRELAEKIKANHEASIRQLDETEVLRRRLVAQVRAATTSQEIDEVFVELADHRSFDEPENSQLKSLDARSFTEFLEVGERVGEAVKISLP